MTTKSIDNFIQNIDSETKTSKAGRPFTIWYAELDDGTRLKFGFNKPKYSVGQRVVGSATQNKFGDMEFSEGGAPAPGASSGSAPARTPPAAGGRTFPVATTSPEMSIIRQNALTNANTAVHNFMSRNASEVTEPNSVDEYVEMVIEAAYKFAEFSSGQREAKRVKAMSE